MPIHVKFEFFIKSITAYDNLPHRSHYVFSLHNPSTSIKYNNSRWSITLWRSPQLRLRNENSILY